MELRVCPECNQAFYSLRDSEVVACPHCGHILHGRRKKERIKKQLDCYFSMEGKTVRAKLQDYSKDGLRMIYRGPALKADTVLDVEIEGLNLHRTAKAVWSMRISKTTASAGLRLL